MTRTELLTARKLIRQLAGRDKIDHLGGANPGAYAWIEDQIDRLLVDSPRPEGFKFGQPARVGCGATGRYLYEGDVVWRSAMDNSLMISEVAPDQEPQAIVLPSDEEFHAVAEIFTHFLPGAMS
jgi:hypothetical protein